MPRVGGTKTLRMDKLRALRPSHVIVNIDENREEDVEPIAAFAPPIVVTHPLAPDDNLALYRLVGGIFGKQREAEQLCVDFQRARDALADAAAALPLRRVLYLIWRDPWMTVSRDTYIAQMLALANWQTLCHDTETRYPEVHANNNLLADADMVLFSSEPFPFKPAHVDEWSRFAGTTRTRCEVIDGEMTSWYGNRAVEGLRYLRKLAARLA